MMAIPSIDMEATGRNITRLRQQAGLTVRDLQEIFGFTTPQAIYKWQHGTAMPAIDNLVVLAAVLNVSIDEIVIVDTRELFLRVHKPENVFYATLTQSSLNFM